MQEDSLQVVSSDESHSMLELGEAYLSVPCMDSHIFLPKIITLCTLLALITGKARPTEAWGNVVFVGLLIHSLSSNVGRWHGCLLLVCGLASASVQGACVCLTCLKTACR